VTRVTLIMRHLRASATSHLLRLREMLFGGYAPPRRFWRRYRPLWVWERSATGRATTPIVRQQGLEVGQGPFAGMRYPEEAVGHATWLGPKLLGAYECELNAVLADVIAADFPVVVNIGAGEGFYAVGLALKSPGSMVYAFETDAAERRLCLSMAESNGVPRRIAVEGECNLARLSALTPEIGGARVFVLCDCEGCELDLLRPDVVPLLQSATLLVELHPSVDSAIPTLVVDRFRSTHEVTQIPRSPSPSTQLHKPGGLRALLHPPAGQPDPEWVYLRPRIGV
jgi:hypothetical protein